MAEHAAREAEVQGTLDRLATAEKEKQAGERIMQSLEQRCGPFCLLKCLILRSVTAKSYLYNHQILLLGCQALLST